MNENAIDLIFELRKSDGTAPLATLPGLWERKLDERWTFWVNGHKEALPLANSRGSSFKVDPYDCYVEFNGWPWGSFSLVTGQGEIGVGTLANYETFCEALRKAAVK